MKLTQGDCLIEMQNIPDDSVDLILTDPPYGTTACKWDSVIPFEPMWEQLNRIIKPNGAIVLFGSEPFSSALRMSNIKNYKYDIVWEKTLFSNPLMAKKRILKIHENISLFYKKQCTYNPQMKTGKPYKDSIRAGGLRIQGYKGRMKLAINNNGDRYPTSVIKFSNGNNGNVHPTQKPVALMEYLIKTYTNEFTECKKCDGLGHIDVPTIRMDCDVTTCPNCNGIGNVKSVVLDFTMGSGSTGVACKNLNRNFIGIELDEDYFNIAKSRIENYIVQTELEF